MRGLLVALMVMAGTSVVRAERRTSVIVPPSACQRAGQQVATVLAEKLEPLVSKRCEKDRWAKDVTLCLAAAPTSLDAHQCMSKLTRDQRIALEGDADRAGSTRLALWLVRESFKARAL
ncbi:MAG TPA: hypothetical protein VLB44_08570, partial [Kofleriaceae bacterium]|nr:hypothetical protein [Kofleriaceae bacterium]